MPTPTSTWLEASEIHPAFLPHSVDENRGATARASLSFNVMFRNFAETLARPMWGQE